MNLSTRIGIASGLSLTFLAGNIWHQNQIVDKDMKVLHTQSLPQGYKPFFAERQDDGTWKLRVDCDADIVLCDDEGA